MSGYHEPVQCTDTQAAAGSGGMYSTTNDMVRFLKYLLYLPGVPAHQNGWSTGMYLDPATLRSVQGLGHAGLPDGIGLGWIEINKQYGESRIVEKTGGGAGFQTYCSTGTSRLGSSAYPSQTSISRGEQAVPAQRSRKSLTPSRATHETVLDAAAGPGYLGCVP